MPKSVEKIVRQLEELNKKIDIILDENGVYTDEITSPLGQAIDSLIDLGDELDSQMEDEEI